MVTGALSRTRQKLVQTTNLMICAMAGGVGGRVRKGLFSILNTLFDRSAIEFGDRDGFFGEDRAPFAGNLDKTAANKELLAHSATVVDGDDARPQRRNQRLVTGHGTEIAFCSGHDNHIGLGRNQQAVRRDQIEGEFVGHIARLSGLGRHFLGLLDGFVDGANHIERCFRHIVMFAVANFLETANGFFQWNQQTRRTGEDLGNMERL